MALVSLKKFTSNPSELDEIIHELENAELAEGQKGSLHYAAGKVLNDLKRYEAVGHFNRA